MFSTRCKALCIHMLFLKMNKTLKILPMDKDNLYICALAQDTRLCLVHVGVFQKMLGFFPREMSGFFYKKTPYLDIGVYIYIYICVYIYIYIYIL